MGSAPRWDSSAPWSCPGRRDPARVRGVAAESDSERRQISWLRSHSMRTNTCLRSQRTRVHIQVVPSAKESLMASCPATTLSGQERNQHQEKRSVGPPPKLEDEASFIQDKEHQEKLREQRNKRRREIKADRKAKDADYKANVQLANKLKEEVTKQAKVLATISPISKNMNVPEDLKNEALRLQTLANHSAPTREIKNRIATIVSTMETANEGGFKLLIQDLKRCVQHVDASPEPAKQHEQREQHEQCERLSKDHEMQYNQLISRFKRSFGGFNGAIDTAVLRRHFMKLQSSAEDVDVHLKMIEAWNNHVKSLPPHALKEDKERIADFLNTLLGTPEQMATFMKNIGHHFNTKDSSNVEASVVNTSTMLSMVCTESRRAAAATTQPPVPTIDVCPDEDDKERGTPRDPLALVQNLLAWTMESAKYLGSDPGGLLHYIYGPPGWGKSHSLEKYLPRVPKVIFLKFSVLRMLGSFQGAPITSLLVWL